MKKKTILFLPTFFLLAFLSGLFPQSAFAASFGLAPDSQEVKVGDQFQIEINLDTQGEEVNGVQAELFFTQERLEVTGINFSEVFPEDFHSIDQAEGWLQLGAGEDLPTASFNGSSVWVTITFEAQGPGLAELTFSCFDSAILELETTHNLLDCGSLGSGSYTITQEPPRPTSTHTPTPRPTTTPGQGGPPRPTSTPTPTPTSLPSPCDDVSPGTPTNLAAVSGPGAGQARLTWSKAAGVDYYNLVFGLASRSYQWGAPNLGDTDQYIVRGLIPGKLYYFAISAVKGCASSGFSHEVSARAKVGEKVEKRVSPRGRITPTPTPTIYQSVEEMFPDTGFLYRRESAEPTQTPTPMDEQEEETEASKETEGGNKLLIFAALVAHLGVLLFVIWRLIRRRGSSPQG